MTSTEFLPANRLILDLTSHQYARLGTSLTLPNLIRSHCNLLIPSDTIVLESVNAEPVAHRFTVTIQFRAFARNGNQIFFSPIDFTRPDAPVDTFQEALS